MGRFKKKGKKEIPAVSTSSLPDIIFMLLFFFMVATVMRETTLYVNIKVPKATEVQKLEKKSAVSYIYIGVPKQPGIYGTEPRIQLNDAISEVEDVQKFVISEKESARPEDRPFLTTSFKVDEETKMGLVTDVKQELRKAGAFKINYSSRKDLKKNNK